MIVTAKFKCPMCENNISVNIFDMVRGPSATNNHYSLVCDECKTRLTIVSEEFEVVELAGNSL